MTPWGRGESRAAAIGTLCLSILLVAGTWWRGALGTSRNDDWGFYRVAFRLADEHQFQLDGWTHMFFLGQAVLSAPVIWIGGPRPAALQLLVAGLGAVGLLVTYRLVRMFLDRRYAVIAIAALALGPMYPQLAVSFMTDVPAFAFSSIALLIGTRAVTSGSRWMFLVALATSFAAFTIREYAAAAGFAILIAAVATRKRSWGWLPVAASAWIIAVIAAYLWRSGLANSVDNQLTLSLSELAEGFVDAGNTIMSLSLFIAPASLAVALPVARRASRREMAVAAVVSALICAAAAANGRVFTGNYFSRKGAGGAFTDGPHPDILDGPLVAVMAILAAGSLVVCTLCLVQCLTAFRASYASESARRDRVDLGSNSQAAVLVSASFVIVSLSLTIGVPIITDAPLFDRNLVPVIPYTGALVMLAGTGASTISARWVTRVGWAVLAVIAVASLQLFDAAAAKDGDAWELSEAIAADGVPADRIDGGPWQGFHQPDLAARRLVPQRSCVRIQWQGAELGTTDQVVAQSMTTTLFGDAIGLEAVRIAPTC